MANGIQTKITLFKETTAINSLRNNDFDAVSAYGEVIDNSIEASANNIKIQFALEGTKGQIKYLAFGDDGYGMNSETLHQCLQLGWSSRYNKREGIGRFGVGMTLAAIHECKKVEIYSSDKVGGEWLYTYVDLDEITAENMKDIPQPKIKNIPNELKHIINDASTGTLVIWSKYDRQEQKGSKLIDESVIWMGRTYRYFIWDGVSISINGEEVKAIDPLYSRTERTRFPNDLKSKVYDKIVINWPVDEFDAPYDAPSTSDITIVLSLLPEEWREYMGAGGNQDTKKRFVHMNEGVSILRNNREVFYGHIPYWSAGEVAGFPHFEAKDRWWGCEIHFNALLDRAFTVKNIKRGAVPNRELKSVIKEKITPTRNSCLEKVEEVWKNTKQKRRVEKEKKRDILDLPGDHVKAEEIAKKTPLESTQIDKDKDFEKEAEKFLERQGDKFSEEQKAALKTIFQSQPFTIFEESWPKGHQFFDVSHFGGSAVLQYNMNHVFFERMYSIVDAIIEEEDPTDLAIELRELIDLLLMAYARGEARFSPDTVMSADEFTDHLRANWGQFLSSYVKTWSKEREEDI